MNDSNTYQAVRIGDTADWRLICCISEYGMSAYLKNVNPTEEVMTLFESKWEKSEATLLQNIENAVFDHPQVLDDFTADITIIAPKAVWVPATNVEFDDEKAAAYYNQVYSARSADIMAETVDGATCLFCLTPGLKPLLQRTFAGARVHSHLAVLVRRLAERSADMPRIYVDIRDHEADIVAFDTKSLLMAATHPWNKPEELQDKIFNIIEVYGIDPDEVQLSLSGLREEKNLLMPLLRKNIKYVMLTMLTSVGAKTGMPSPAALLLRNS